MAAGVGWSGSPTSTPMTSTPSTRSCATRSRMPAKKYSGVAASRAAARTAGPLTVWSPAGQLAAEHDRRRPGHEHRAARLPCDGERPAAQLHLEGPVGEPERGERHRGGAGAGAAGVG